MDSPLVSIIVLNWNGLKDTIQCLESLQKIKYPNYEVIVVDNASQGADVKTIQAQFGDRVHVIANDRNYGYTGGNNIGLRYALAHSAPVYCLVLNNDVVVDPDFLTQLVNAAHSDPSVGLVGPKVYFRDLPNVIQTAGGTIDMRTGNPGLIGNKKVDTGLYNQSAEVAFLSGSCLLVRTAVMQQIGLLDEAYFLYWDDVEYCARVKEAGYKLLYAAQAKVWHNSPVKKNPWSKTPSKARANRWTHYYGARNYFKFIRRYSSKAQYATSIVWFFGYHFWFEMGVCLIWYRDPGRFAAFCRGVYDGLLHPSRGGAVSDLAHSRP